MSMYGNETTGSIAGFGHIQGATDNVPESPVGQVVNRLRDAIHKNRENTDRLRNRLTSVLDNGPQATQEPKNEKRDTYEAGLVLILHNLADEINSISNEQNEIMDRLQL